MGKKREDREKGSRFHPDQDTSLDGDFISPIHSWGDFTAANLLAVLKNSRYTQFILALTVLGLFLHLYHLDFNSLWLDEASTLTVSKTTFLEIWQTSLSGEFHPPLYHWITHLMLTFGQSEFILRIVPAILGTLTIPVFYLIGKELRDRNTGIISAALLTVSYFGIFYSQEARAYSMVLFVFSLVILFYLRALRTNALSEWVLFGFFSAVAIWTHYYTLIGIGVIYLHAIITLQDKLRQNMREAKNPLIGLGVLAVLGLPLLVVVIQRYFALTSSPPTYGVLGPILLQETLVRFSGGYSSFSWLVAVVYLIVMALGFILLFSEDRNKTLFCGMLLVLPLVISVILSSKMTMNPRYLIYLLPIYFSVIALAYPLLYKLIPNRNLVYGVVLAVLLINAPLLTEYYSSYVKEDWRGFAGIVESKTQNGDMVVVAPGYMLQPFTYYYSNVTDKTIESGGYTATDLDSVYKTKGNSTMYLVVTGDISAANPQGDALAWMNEHTKIIDQHTGIYLLVAA